MIRERSILSMAINALCSTPITRAYRPEVAENSRLLNWLSGYFSSCDTHGNDTSERNSFKYLRLYKGGEFRGIPPVFWPSISCDYRHVGCHRGTIEPLGRVANADSRRAKRAAHVLRTWDASA